MNQTNEILIDNHQIELKPTSDKRITSSVMFVSACDRNMDVSRIMLDDKQKDRIIEMAWEDRTPFEAIFFQFGLREDAVKQLMKTELRFSNYKRWRERVAHCKTKHQRRRSTDILRFKSSMQRAITCNKISKR